MTTSYQTAEAIFDAVVKHVTESQLRAIIADLKKIDGNASFIETVRQLDKIAEETEKAAAFGKRNVNHA